jgi:hypothetical protein
VITGIRARVAGGVGGVVAMVLTIAFAAPASAATLFTAHTKNEATGASLLYHYDRCNSAGYCHIVVTDAQVVDMEDWCGDGWGGVLSMHHSDSDTPEDLAVSADCNEAWGRDIDRTGYKDVWFEVCNLNATTGQRYSCVRLHK